LFHSRSNTGTTAVACRSITHSAWAALTVASALMCSSDRMSYENVATLALAKKLNLVS
jgi:hypothetical protein